MRHLVVDPLHDGSEAVLRSRREEYRNQNHEQLTLELLVITSIAEFLISKSQTIGGSLSRRAAQMLTNSYC